MNPRLSSAVATATLLWGTSLAAQPRDDAARAGMLTEAERASDRGDHAQALDLATRAGAIRMTPSLRGFIAQEHHALGHLLEAYDAAVLCEREARADPTARRREQTIATCSALSAELSPRIGRVTVRVPDPPPGVRVRVADAELASALWGLPYPVRPGRVVVEAAAESRRPFRVEVDVGAGQNADVVVSLAPAPVAPSTPPATTAVTPVIPTTTRATPDSRVTTQAPPRTSTATASTSPPLYARWWFWTIIGAGVIGAATALAVGLSGTQDPIGGLSFTTNAIEWR